MSHLNVVILAAGKGSRMHSDLPKVLHKVAGKTLLAHVVDTAEQLHPERMEIIYGHGKKLIEAALKDSPHSLILQPELLGSGHAMQQAISYIDENDTVLVLYGDMPFISIETLTALVADPKADEVRILTVVLNNPTGYGRIVRENGQVVAIVEDKDTTVAERAISEINTGILLLPGKPLKTWLSKLRADNAQHEYYITDIIKFAHEDGYRIKTVQPHQVYEAEGINDRQQQARLERRHQHNQAAHLLNAGVTLRDPARFDLRGVLKHGRDVLIDINVIIEGEVQLGNRVEIGSGCIIRDAIIEDDVIVSPYSIIEGSHLKSGVRVGPFARVRPECILDNNAHIGNFVEMKKTRLGKASKAGHLSYLGDSDIGANVNIGAGTITCNYDGVSKHKTQIADNVFVGSDSQFVAPVRIGKGATIAAGTTVTANVAENELVLARAKTRYIADWKRPQKDKK